MAAPRTVVSAAAAVLTLVVGAGSVAGQSHEVTFEELGAMRPNARGDEAVHFGRITLPPGATIPGSEFGGAWSVFVDSGLLEMSGELAGVIVEGDLAESYGFSEDGGVLGVRPGSQFSFGDGTRMRWVNPGDQPTVLLTMAMVQDDVEPILRVEEADARRRAATVTPFTGEVVKRLVLHRPDGGPCEHKLTIRDFSGRLRGARVPAAAELRFLERRDALERDGVAVGPVASRDGGYEVLVSWLGSDCGPTARVDIGKGVDAIRIENLCFCDSAGAVHSVALRFKGGSRGLNDVNGFLRGR